MERIVVETGRHRIVGDLRLPSEGYRSRLSDFLNRSDLEFVALTSARIQPLEGNGSAERPFLAVARTHIVIAYPDGGDPEV